MSIPRKRRFPRTPIVKLDPYWRDIGGGYLAMSFSNNTGGSGGGYAYPYPQGGGGGSVTFKWPEGERIYTGGGPR